MPTTELPYQGLTALVVDDELCIIPILRDYLEMLGFAVDTALNPDQARMFIQEKLSRSSSAPYDLLITDQNMEPAGAREKGSDFLASIQRQYPGMKRVLHSSDYLASQAHDVGAGYIQKPNVTSQLIPVLQELFPERNRSCGHIAQDEI